MNTDGSDVIRLTDHPEVDMRPRWSPDGGRIAFVSARDGNAEIYAMNSDGSGVARLTNNPADDFLGGWSPNGQRMALSSDRDGNREIYVMNADGSGVIRLTDHPDLDQSPAWSPDGKHIAFTSRRDGDYEIYAMRVDGAGLTKLTDNSHLDEAPVWTVHHAGATNMDRISQPDLAVSAIAWEPKVPTIGMDTAVEVTIENHGSERAERTKVAFQVDGETVDEATLSTIDPGESVTKRFDWSAEEGKSSFGATVDPENQIEELDETNNTTNINFGGAFLPDLVVESITWEPASASVSDTVAFTVTIKNQGLGSSRASSVRAEVDGHHHVDVDVEGVAARGSVAATFEWVAAAGEHQFTAVADSEGWVAETDESNNVLTVGYARPSDILDWFDDPPDDAHSFAARSIGRIWDRYPDLAVGVARLAWVADGITWYEEYVLEELSYIMHEDPEILRAIINQEPRSFLLGLGSESARRAAEYPWLADGVNAREFSSVIAIARIAQRNPTFAERVLSYTWLADGIIEDEARGLDALTLWASQDPELVDRVLEYAWLGDVFTDHEQKTLALLYYFGTHAEVETTKLVMNYPWLVDGVTGEEVVLLAELTSLVDDDPEAARSIGLGRLVPYLLEQVSGSAGQAANFPWLADGVDTKELMAVIEVGRIAKQAPELAGQLLKYVWLADGVSQRESAGIVHMASLARENLELARQVVGMGMLDDPLRDRDLHALTALATKADFDNLALLTKQPWFADGLSDEETAFLAVTPIILDTGHRDILQRRFTRSATISLPLAGDVDVWAFWHSPFPDSDDTIELIEDAARASEALMGVPFPTTDIIILLGEPDRVPTSGFHAGNHIGAQRWVGEGNHRGVIYHETAHYYYMGVHSWFNEGYADLVVTYTMVQEGLRDLAERIAYLEEYDLPDCVEQGYRNIQELLDKDGPPCLGELFLDSLLQLLGEDAMSPALRELYLMRTEGREPTEADVYQIFLKHTPAGLEDEFRDLYKRLHGGPYADTDK